ncbi:MAG: GDP-L-fucose synthase [Tetrasphaera sp.]|jgi:GDP-L-fucose synthase|nr:GDP-L-fucose synthase [Tetrasphaera sp.]
MSYVIPAPLDRSAPVLIAGRGGLVGSALWSYFLDEGFTNLLGPRSGELDLRDRAATHEWFRTHRPRYVVDAAAKVGGIVANATYPYDFISDNLRIQVNLMDAALRAGVERFLFLGSACIYPKLTAQPITESALMTGYLEESNEAYAVAKIAGVFQIEAARHQHGVAWISAMPTNLYGPGDNFSRQNSHVFPALIRRYVEAADAGVESVTNWGTGTPTREFLHSRDMAAGALFLLENYDGDEPVNIGVGEDLPLSDLAQRIAAAAGFTGRTEWDASRPDGTPRRLMDVSRIRELGWRPTISLDEGIAEVVAWFRANHESIREH